MEVCGTTGVMVWGAYLGGRHGVRLVSSHRVVAFAVKLVRWMDYMRRQPSIAWRLLNETTCLPS
jgi:hypothetical protein